VAADIDPIETQEWLEALSAVIREQGDARASYLLAQLNQAAQQAQLSVPSGCHTPYINTIPTRDQPSLADEAMLERLSALIRWNAVAMVLRAGKLAPELGGHIASYASSAVLYEVGFNHFFHAPNETHGGDLIYYQGHSSPGIYARAFLEGRISEAELENFRQEATGQGLSSYPHPWLMPHFWQFPTVSMGLGPIQAIYQARFLKYLGHRGLADTKARHVWAFLGDGETDEPESLGAIGLAAREHLDNLIFVVNCNLQRLDGPVRGNGKIIQELEGIFRGAGWQVIKVIWGSSWDALLDKDSKGLLQQRMMECLDGEYQYFQARGGAYLREHFFGVNPELKQMVAHLSDDELDQLNRGGHDWKKVFAAYHRAVNQAQQPTVILAKTVKGFGMGEAGESRNITHQQKKMTTPQLQAFRDRFKIPVADTDIEAIPFYRPSENSPELQYLQQQRAALGGSLPIRRQLSQPLTVPDLSAFEPLLRSSGERQISTTMAFVRLLNILLKDSTIGQFVVPIIPDECRTFGMEGMFRQYGIYSPHGQLYTPEDAEQVMYYREAQDGVVLEEGITEAGGFCSWLAAATSYNSNALPMLPFYIYYSMFGFQRIGDLAWAAGDMRARGFLLGGTAGRTTLAGEGLQHQDGHSHILAGTVPNCVSYDPTFAYEVAVIIQDGLRRMYTAEEDVFYYLTLMNENYTHPDMPQDCETGILRGLYCVSPADETMPQVQLLGSGTILLECLAAQKLLADFGVSAGVWSVTSFNELARDAKTVARYNMLHPQATPQQSYAQTQLPASLGPIVAATDYIRSYAEQIRSELSNDYLVLGTDGFGRSDTRQALRAYFEIDQRYITVAALYSLARQGKLEQSKVTDAMTQFGIDPDTLAPWLR
jgi:pyruvate dehydrogenase E1 component